MSQVPPLARKLLRWFLRSDLAEEVEGDLNEKFRKTVDERGLLRAQINFWFEVLNYIRPFALRKKMFHILQGNAMLKNHLVIGWRNLSRQKIYSAIKIGGFATGLAACILIAVFIRVELTYDRHYPDGDRIFRILRNTTFRGESSYGVHFPAPFAAALKQDFPDIEKIGRYNETRFFGAQANEVRRTDQVESIHEDGFAYIDQSLVDLFQLPFLAGNPQNALSSPNTILITRRIADKHFRGEDPLGKVLILNNDEAKQYTITGVIEDPPATSHLQFKFLMTLTGYEFNKGEQSNWRNSNYPTYVLLRTGTDARQFEKRLSSTVNKYFLPGAIENDVAPGAEELAWLKSTTFRLQPVRDIYMNRLDIHDGLSHGDVRYIGLFTGIAIFILLIACVNFINLSTARAANRAREVGLRKVVGSRRISLIHQFLTESVLLSLLAFGLGIILAVSLLPYFSTLVNKTLTLSWNEMKWIPALGLIAITVGTCAGLYPAFYLSAFQPIQVLKGNLSHGSKGTAVRSALVVFQFTMSAILIVGTVVIGRQMDYVLAKKVGYDKDQILVLNGTHTLRKEITRFKDQLTRIPGVRFATISGNLPVDGSDRNNNSFFNEGKKGIDQGISAQRWSVDHDYVKTLGLKIIDGRDYSIDIASDSSAMIINQSMAKVLNIESPVGKRITNGWSTWTIIGVMEDFHFESMKRQIGPLCFNIERNANAIAVKINTNDVPRVIQGITATWKTFSPNQAIRYAFLNDSYSRMYDDVRRMGNTFKSFALLAILVACLGLYALSSFMVEQRQREISIRLVLGASINGIFRLLTANFLKLIALSLIISSPLAFYLMKEWLNEFAYRIEITWDVFFLTGLAALGITLFTISFQSIRAALVNPVDSLRAQ